MNVGLAWLLTAILQVSGPEMSEYRVRFSAELGFFGAYTFSGSGATSQLSPDAQARRIQQLIKDCRSPRVELSSLQAVQEGKDVVVRGKGRNTGDCVLASLKVRARLGSEVDGVLVRSGGRPALEVPVGSAFSFELWFYDTAKPRQMTVWFALDDLRDDRFENDPAVPAVLGQAAPQQQLTVR